MKFRLDDQADPVARLVEAMEEFLMAQAVPMKTIYSANIWVEELLVNIINHGYAGAPAPDVEVDVEVAAGRLVIEVSDGAAPFDPTTDAVEPDTDAELDDRPIGGLGIHLIKKLTDEMSYRRDGGRNHVRLVKVLESGDAPGAID
jgi:anti-sigma regulatory factor (Ser/Thr protein kinase)